MSQIRRQSIISSIMVYGGFALGFLNTYLFTKEGGFTKEQYGLTGIFIAIATLMFSIANMAMPAYIGKFYPYYKDNLPRKKNDMLSWALLISMIGFCLVVLAGWYFRDIAIRKFGNAPELIRYYYWIFPFGLGLTLFGILESYSWQLQKSVLTNFLREVQFRLFTTILIVLSFAGWLTNFDIFIKIYSFTYLAVAAILFFYLLANGHIHLCFEVSNVTKRFYKKILTLVSFVYGGSLVYTISLVFDSLVLAIVMKDALGAVAVYTVAQNIASLIQAPQRGIIASSIGALSQGWKDKDMPRIQRIYKQSSINQLIFSVAMFALIWLNFTDGVLTFKMQKVYLDAKWVFLFIGLYRIIDMGTGISGQIIGTSTRWRFDFFTGTVLICITLPLNYILTKYTDLGVMGPAVANLFSFTVYNAIRFWFLKTKYNLQPFTKNTAYTVLLGAACYLICYFLFDKHQGFIWIVIRSITFLLFYITGTLLLDLSSDIAPVWNTVLKRTGIKKEG